MNPPPRRLYLPKRVPVSTDEGGTPLALGSVGVESVREEWLVEDRWWTPSPLRRRYFELVLDDGRDVVVFQEQPSRLRSAPARAGSWFLQRA
jgi:hypothetical protein